METLAKVLDRLNFPSAAMLKRRAFKRLRGRDMRVGAMFMRRVFTGVVMRVTGSLFREVQLRKIRERDGRLLQGYAKLKDAEEADGKLMEPAEIHGGAISVGVNTTATRLHKTAVVCRVMGRFMARLEAEIGKDCRVFFTRLKWTRKRQMEIAFLKAAVEELRKLEVGIAARL